ncbi:unnamed protein product [Parnassius mnemosyne]|uniref:EndoU domain-containing protein n=1 Tax=Parnassius mnemosyne TaxID=213953 RepID=A0AAV1M4G6_9NEOP
MELCVRMQFLLIGLLLQLGICSNKVQRYNPNTDFLLHEAGGITTAPKRDYVAEFPSLKPSSSTQQQSRTTQNLNTNSGTTLKPQSPKRDYVAEFPSLKPSSSTLEQSRTTQNLNTNSGTTLKPQSPKRDYVAPQFPLSKQTPANTHKTTSPQQNITPYPNNNLSPTFKPSSMPKRDYVAPQFPTLKPTQDSSKKSSTNVKDLINFYDNINKDNNNNPRKPSYSSILQGSTAVTPSTPLATHLPQKTTPTTKTPMSFSSVVAGTTKHTTINPTQATPHAQKPTIPNSGKNTQPTGRPVLPSSILNNNKNTNQTSGLNIVSDAELQVLSEELLRKDINNAAKYVTINYQGKTTSQSKEDNAPQPLLTIASEAWNIPTIQKFVPLLDNYERDTLVNEYVTAQERIEENTFMDAIMSTTVIRHLMNFFKEKGYVMPDPRQQRDFLKQLWFGLYSRGKGKISSSGFEHVFVSELKNGEVSGLHNWIYFSKEETANRINYLGYLKYVEINDKGVVMKFHFNQQGVDKPVNSMFIGTSPELEIALYTLCFVTRVGEDCHLKLGNKDVNILTHNFRYRSKSYIGSAFPQI